MNRKCCLHLTPCNFTSFSVSQLVSLGPDLRISFQFVRKPHMLETLHQMLTDWSSYLTGKILSKCVRSAAVVSRVFTEVVQSGRTSFGHRHTTHTCPNLKTSESENRKRMKLTFRGRHEMPAAVSLTYFTSPSCCPVCMSCTHTLIWRVKHTERKSI